MTVAIHVQGPGGETITTFNLFDDVYDRLATQAAINGVAVVDHIREIITGHAQDIINSIEDNT